MISINVWNDSKITTTLKKIKKYHDHSCELIFLEVIKIRHDFAFHGVLEYDVDHSCTGWTERYLFVL
jgi:hypothetical protein